MDFRGLAVGAGNVARGYRAAETELRAAEVQRLNLQHLRQEQAERDRQEAERRALLEKPPELPGGRVPLGGVPGRPLSGMQLPAPQALPVRDVRPPATTQVPDERAWAEIEARRGREAAAAPPEMYVGPAPAPVTPLPAEQVAQNPEQLARAQGVYRLAAMNLRDAQVTLDALRAQGADPARIDRQQGLVDRRRTDLQAADQGIRRLVPSAVTAPVGRPAVPAASATARRAQEYDAKQTPYDELIRQSAVQAGVDPVAFKRLLGTESSFNPNAVSPLGPQFGLGIAQIAAVHGLPDADRLNPEKAIPFAAQLFSKYLQEAGGDYEQALLKYKGASSAAGRQAMAAPVATITAGLAATPAAPVATPAAAGAAEEPPPGPAVAALTKSAGVAPPEDENVFQQAYADPRQITADQKHLEREYSQRRQTVVDAAVSTLTRLDMTYNAQRQTLVARYNAQIEAGRSSAAMATRDQIDTLDDRYSEARTLVETGSRNELLDLDSRHDTLRRALIGQAAVAQLVVGRNPTAAAQVVSYMSGSPVQFRLTSDGNIDMLLPQANGSFAVRGTYSIPDIADMVNNWSSQQYRDAKAATQREVAIKVTEQQAQMIRELAKARVETQGRLQEITLRGQQFTGQADGNGGVILYTPDGSRAGRLVERQTTVDGLPVSTFVLQPIQMPPR